MQLQPICHAALQQAVDLIRQGQCVAFPTETVYGLGADATNENAIAKIYATKGRPANNPLIIHVADTGVAKDVVYWSQNAEKLARAFWPGPLTLVLRRREDASVSLLASAGGDTLAVRMPAHSGARELLKMAGVPIAAPSANRSGKISPTVAQHVVEELGKSVPLILDGGPCNQGLESTVVECHGGHVILRRFGSITPEMVIHALGGGTTLMLPETKPDSATQRSTAMPSPGMLSSHYAPSLPVRLEVGEVKAGEALLAYGPDVPEGAAALRNLSPKADLSEAAANLFAMLRALDKPEYTGIAVMPIPREGLGLAMNDRLRRAAADRR